MWNRKKYQPATGSVMYLSICTRPDIANAVNSLAIYTSCPTKEHLKRLLHYLRGTLKHGIVYTKNDLSM